MKNTILQAVALIESDFPGQTTKMLADFIEENFPHAADGDEVEQRTHALLLDLCETLDRAGLPRPFNMQQR